MFGGKLIRVNEAIVFRLRASSQFPCYRKRISLPNQSVFPLALLCEIERCGKSKKRAVVYLRQSSNGSLKVLIIKWQACRKWILRKEVFLVNIIQNVI